MTGNLWILIALGSALLTAAQFINIRQHWLRRARPYHRSLRTPCNVGGSVAVANGNTRRASA